MAPKTKKRRNVPRLPVRDEQGWHSAQEQLSLELQRQQDYDSSCPSSSPSSSEDEGSDHAHLASDDANLSHHKTGSSFSFLSALEEHEYLDDSGTDNDEEAATADTSEKQAQGGASGSKKRLSQAAEASAHRNSCEASRLGPEDYRIFVGSLAAELIEEPMASLFRLRKLLSMIRNQSIRVRRSRSASNSTPVESAEHRSEQESRLKLLLISCLAVFQDILPGYAIRPPTTAELAVKVSKDVKQQRDYESSLLSCYKQYLMALFSLVIQMRRRLASSEAPGLKAKPAALPFYPFHICQVAVKCLLELLSLASAQHNFFRELVDGLCFILFNDKRGALIDLVATALAQGFRVDDTGFFTWSIVKALSEDCQRHRYHMPAKILESLISIKVGNLKASPCRRKRELKRDKSASHGHKTNAVHVSKRNKKYLKEELKWKKELEEAEATISQNQLEQWASLDRLHQESLRYLFRIYIGLIKKNPVASLLTFVFPGLLKFSNMIHEDYFADLLVSLKNILPSILAHTKTSILCLTAVFTILTQQSQFLQLDLHWYYKTLYSLMLSIPERKLGLEMHPARHAHSGRTGGSFGKKKHTGAMRFALSGVKKAVNVTHVWKPAQAPKTSVDPELVPAFIACFEKMFLGRMQVPLDRIAAFAHRVIWICLSLDAASILLLVDLLAKALRHYSNLIPLLLGHVADEEDRFGSGAYDPLAEDPDQCRASSESVLPLAELLIHVHPDRQVASKLAQLLKLYHGDS